MNEMYCSTVYPGVVWANCAICGKAGVMMKEIVSAEVSSCHMKKVGHAFVALLCQECRAKERDALVAEELMWG